MAKFFRWVLRITLILFITSLLYTVICKWVFPPITLTQTGAVFGGYGLKRDYVSWDEISPNVKLAAMASEDQLFPDHGGFDWKALEKSLNANPKKKKKVRGGGASTISQQTAKNVFLWQGNGALRYIRKVPEFYFTKMIEWTWGKKRILEVYLNVIEMGPGIFGIEAAAQKYFGKPAKNLSRTEAAMIIACLPNPKIYTVKPVSRWVGWKSKLILRQMNNIQDDPDVQALMY
ncbi:monofunctional biosynthetic peptidoglycan transglycosylase [Filimonas lacunae]|uniref:Biosynthetic peptidoglycan transglycosylase n=1 Tax=Filimonas lacunae TaxID=477680 RepID=A0A173MQJ0_9BACT|nr:monofunctional biosynthetic peptidoglycan transglycosylase [Filimonas lacunae]BAV09641.1 monofunctional biosynthetic peptidoglycan transglycosylase [Filimonas lacunae]SIS76392.1 monofunctional biosynthetic peptidoglycan transglycosylase [Filimonas lacunae]